ncbi:MAG: di-heme oxidoredictase family protein [Pseudomonadota bacterium]
MERLTLRLAGIFLFGTGLALWTDQLVESYTPAATTLPKPGASWERLHQPSGTLIAPAAHLDSEGRLKFYTGLSFFKAPWIKSPASTTARDGLGPLFNANSCISCHKNGGRSRSLITDPETSTAVVRISIPVDGESVAPHPVYGNQIQTKSTYGTMAGEGLVAVSVTETHQVLHDRRYTLRKPSLEFSPISGRAEGYLTSLRVAPSLIGMGLLEAIPSARLESLEQAQKQTGQVSGRIHWVESADGKKVPGRFGWKALQPDVAAQTGSAFRDDLGITNPYFPDPPCTAQQSQCLQQAHGNDEDEGVEITQFLFDYAVHFTANIPPPAAGKLTPKVAQGRELFERIGCAACHVPSHQTEFGEIWPYSDLLLHDMGEGLADHRPEGDATGREWRTPPLWGLGTQKKVSGHTELLHDGRARNSVEAVLWHGGEAAAARDNFTSLSDEEIASVRAFLSAI